MKYQKFYPGTVIIKEGDVSDGHFYVIIKGTVGIYKTHKNFATEMVELEKEEISENQQSSIESVKLES